jgi:ABC-type enterochelin transport system permease subunit
MSGKNLTRAGVWIAVISAAIWVGDHIIQAVVDYTPFAIGVGIVLMAIGLFMDKKAVPIDKQS